MHDAYTAGETATAAEMTSSGLLRADAGCQISGHALFVPADEQGTVRPVTMGPGCRIGPFAVIYGGTVLADAALVEEHAVIGKPEHGYAVGKVYEGAGTGTAIGAGTVIAMTMAVVTRGPSSLSSSARQAEWSLSARSAVATRGPVSTIST